MGTLDDPKAFAARHFEQAPGGTRGIGTVERYATDPPMFMEALHTALGDVRPGDRVCELGFGSGWLLDELLKAYPGARFCGLDLAAAMVRQARDSGGARASLLQGDMEDLPFARSAFDRVITCWTLYFMNDIDRAVAEAARVLRPGGRFIAATVAPDHMKELSDLSRAVSREVEGRVDWTNEVDERFDMETGLPYVERHFGRVEVKEWRGELVLPEVDTLVDFWEQFHQEQVQGGEVQRYRDAVRRHGRAMRGADGKVRIRRHDGLFVGYRN